ncbi:MAG: 1,4-alpha-glucan branching protein GlgB [Chitinivibrionales bacterium]|nr:1,4-alpha-glucan branching protein GlgB [Chitinivibrionales bacterium]MBD3394974.1 1,4-alpha-glucan branching protein GlgB [Chitinivibrionales bacterium]
MAKPKKKNARSRVAGAKAATKKKGSGRRTAARQNRSKAPASPPPVAHVVHGPSLLNDFDIHLFREGSYFRMYETFGAHHRTIDAVEGVQFCVWAPNAREVAVIGDFNGWDPASNPLAGRWDGSGIWEGFVSGVGDGTLYKYRIVTESGAVLEKSDPFAYYWETSPKTASAIWNIDYQWHDQDWMSSRAARNSLEGPMSVYEVHLGSWQRVPEEGNRSLSYREMAEKLGNYVEEMGFTHVEFLPVMEHPFFGSWGYQTVGYFAPTSRYGTPQDFMYLVDSLHQRGIGVILDWVPSHFPSDAHGLAEFDGTHLYEHADPRQGFHPEWKTYVFNYGRHEVRSFLISSALFWLDKYHIDGLRVDAVASMLYLDYARKDGEWIPNTFGGRENMEAVGFLRRLNQTVYAEYPATQTIAEESTAWPMVSRPVYAGGLGFGLKWNMGWMHDTLEYFAREPIHRKYHHNQLTFSMMYAFTENFALPLSHDEVVYGKRSLLGRMPGDDWQKRANLRLLLGYLFMHPGKKLLFMGGEFGQFNEWNHDTSLDWHLLHDNRHGGIRAWMMDVCRFYRAEPALYERDFSDQGFRWIDCNDIENSILSFYRHGTSEKDTCIVACNFTPVPREKYRIGVPQRGSWKEVLNSDAAYYGGSGMGNRGEVVSRPVGHHGHFDSIAVVLPPLSIVVFKYRNP